jgi:hypothetical protein
MKLEGSTSTSRHRSSRVRHAMRLPSPASISVIALRLRRSAAHQIERPPLVMIDAAKRSFAQVGSVTMEITTKAVAWKAANSAARVRDGPIVTCNFTGTTNSPLAP